MSQKPMKKSEERKQDALQQKMQMKMQKKKQEDIGPIPPPMYIVSEGTKTEPNYLRDMVQQINQKHNKYATGKTIVMEGTGRNTTDLLDYAKKQVKKQYSNVQVVWLVYDKDDFPKGNFNTTQIQAENTSGTPQYRVAWSNESVELWFLLHFQDFPADNGREQYIKLLKKYLPDYSKNQDNVFQQLKPHMGNAIRRAKNQYTSYDHGATPTQRVPATRMFELVEYLETYL